MKFTARPVICLVAKGVVQILVTNESDYLACKHGEAEAPSR